MAVLIYHVRYVSSLRCCSMACSRHHESYTFRHCSGNPISRPSINGFYAPFRIRYVSTFDRPLSPLHHHTIHCRSSPTGQTALQMQHDRQHPHCHLALSLIEGCGHHKATHPRAGLATSSDQRKQAGHHHTTVSAGTPTSPLPSLRDVGATLSHIEGSPRVIGPAEAKRGANNWGTGYN